MRAKRAKLAKLTVIAAFATIAFAASALATTLYYYAGYLNGLYLGPRHSLTESSVRVLSNFPASACTTAYNTDGSRAGTPYCAAGYNSLAAHPYCGCRLRYPAVSSGGSNLRARLAY